MKVLKNLTFAGVSKFAVVGNADDGERAARPAEVLARLANLYQPSPKLELNLGEIRSLVRAVDALEKHATDDTVEFEDEHWAVLAKVVRNVLPRVTSPAGFFRDVPAIEDVLKGVEHAESQR